MPVNMRTGQLIKPRLEVYYPIVWGMANLPLRLSEIVEAQIIARQIPLLGKFEGPRPDQDYYIADKCLVIYFQLYEITPYVVGFPYFPISVYDIQDIIREDGPLGQMM